MRRSRSLRTLVVVAASADPLTTAPESDDWLSMAPAESRAWVVVVGLSVCLHVGLAGWILNLPRASALAPTNAAATFDPDLGDPRAPETGTAHRAASRAEAGGRRSAQNVDAPDRGEGGDDQGAAQFMWLVSGAHGALLHDSPHNAPGVSQVQRIRVARHRTSYEDRRATPNPDDQPFLASGSGPHPERRRLSPRDAADGARVAPTAALRGGQVDRASFSSDDRRTALSPAAEHAGAASDSPGRGILGGRGARSSDAARVAFGRPAVDRGPAATLAQTPGRPSDNVDAELLAGQLVQSVVDASQRSARTAGEGRGGVGGGGAPGSGGGRTEGGRASPFGPGSGRFAALDTSDTRYRRWYLDQRRRIEERLVFPRERSLARDQGTCVYRLRIRRDGSLASAPQRIRSTGFSDMDQSARRAIVGAAPFPALPSDLAPELDVLRLDMTIEFSNPMVQ